MPLKFRKVLLADKRYESAGVFDVNNDGALDIVSGAHWYEGPDFKKVHPIGNIRMDGDYFDDFSTIPLDINGDGLLDFVTGGWFSGTLRWQENPGDPQKEWPAHVIAQCGNVETVRAHDIDGDGVKEIIPNLPNDPLIIYKLDTDSHGKGKGTFTAHTLFEGPQKHGLGFGDIAGNGRMDCILAHGWLEAPADPFREKWRFHQEFDLGYASIPILVADVNKDGLNDLIVGQAHRYGLDWWEQRRDAQGRRSWVKHEIDPFNSQYHDLIWADIDGDGECELITGKRYMAHCGSDPGEYDPVGIYYFKWTGECFVKQIIDYGPARVATGCGIHFAVADLTGNGLLDLVAPGKDGLYVFYNEGA